MSKSHDNFMGNRSGKSGQDLPHRAMGTHQKAGNANMHSQGGGLFPKGAGAGGSASFKATSPSKKGGSSGNAC